MTIVAIGFLIVFFGLIGLVWQLGDRDDHKMMVAITIAIIATSFSGLLGELERRVLVRIVDICLALAITYHALKSERHWPLWFAGFVWATVILGLLAFALPGEQADIYFFASTTLSLPALLVMAIGLMLDSKAKNRGLWETDLPPG